MADGQTRKAGEVTPALSYHEAFLRAQRAFPQLKKSTQGQRGKYSPLDTVLAALVPVLNQHDIAVRQITKIDGDRMWVETTLTHIPSGQSEASQYPVGENGTQHQTLGAGLTYARRYGLMSHCGIYPEGEDKDGANAGKSGRQRESGPVDYDSAVAQMQVKLLNCTTEAEVDKVWNANHKLRGALKKDAPQELERLEGRYKTRKHELSGNRGSLFNGEE